MVNKHNQDMARLEVKNLYHQFDGIEVIKDLNLSIQSGQVTCLPAHHGVPRLHSVEGNVREGAVSNTHLRAHATKAQLG